MIHFCCKLTEYLLNRDDGYFLVSVLYFLYFIHVGKWDICRVKWSIIFFLEYSFFAGKKNNPEIETSMKVINDVLGLSLLFMMVGCSSGKMKQVEVAPVQVKTITVVPQGMEREKRFSGTLEAETETSLSFSVMGTVEKVCIKQGDRVEVGTLIAELNEVSMRNSYMAAQATLQQAEDAFLRMKELYDKGSLAEIKWVEVQSKLQQARSMEQVAKKNMEDCKLFAPCSGVIADKKVEVGQNVISGMPIATLLRIDGLKVKIAVPESEIGQINIGQEAEVSVQALDGRRFMGKIVEKGVMAHSLSRTYDVKIHLKDDINELMPGMVAEVMVKMKKETDMSTYIVPVQVLQLDEHNHSFVWLDQDGKAKKRFVTCGKFTSGGVVIEAGLSRGDKIIVEGQQKVCEGLEIKNIG